MSIFSFLSRPKSYEVYGPNGGISTSITLPEGFDPSSDKCPLVVLMHGFMSSKKLYPVPALAKALAAEGIASLSFDFDAHGKSEGKFIDMTVSSEIEDAKAVIRYAGSLPFVSGIALAGHSQGGVIAGMTAGELEGEGVLRPACVVLMAPAAVLKDDALKGQCMNARYDASNPPEYVNVFFHKLGRKFILEAQKLPIYETTAKYTGKVCIIHGTRDKIVPLSYGERYHTTLPSSELHVLEGESHFLKGDSKSVTALAVNFLKQNLM